MGQCWHEHFRKAIWKGSQILLLHTSHEALFTLQEGSKCLWVKRLTFSIKCAVKLYDAITAARQGV